jgi:hypothetical protein
MIPSSSYDKIFTENYSETNFVVTSMVFSPRARISVNIHWVSFRIFPYLRLNQLSVEFISHPKTIGQEMSESEHILRLYIMLKHGHQSFGTRHVRASNPNPAPNPLPE